MDEIKLFIGNDIEQYESGSIVGQIFFKVDDYYFPEKEWFDFPIQLWLGGWMDLIV